MNKTIVLLMLLILCAGNIYADCGSKDCVKVKLSDSTNTPTTDKDGKKLYFNTRIVDECDLSVRQSYSEYGLGVIEGNILYGPSPVPKPKYGIDAARFEPREEDKKISDIPFLDGSIPYLKSESDSKSDTLILITPKIIEDQED